MLPIARLVTGIAFVGAVLTGPAAVAAYMLSGPTPSPVLQLAPTSAAATPGAGTLSGRTEPVAAAGGLVTGVLYTNGTARVDWNGVAIPVENGSYAYVGGELITMGGEAMGLLELGPGNTLFLCPGSKARVSRTGPGPLVVEIVDGTARFAFSSRTDFAVQANGTQLHPDMEDAAEDTRFVGEVEAREDGRSLYCAVRSGMRVAAAGSAPLALGALDRIVEIGRPGAGSTPSVSRWAMSADVLRALARTGDTAYLCRCRELRRYAEDRGEPVAEASRVTLPEGVAPPLSSPTAPALAPPVAPPMALSVPGAPVDFDPNVLPPPAPGIATPTVTVPPPLVPIGGSGGAYVVSPA